MKRIRYLFMLLLCFMTSIALFGCTEPVSMKGTIYAFSTFIDISFQTENLTKDEAKAIYDEIEETYKEINKLSDNFYEQEKMVNICTINKEPGTYTVDEKLSDMLAYALHLRDETNGYFNPLIGNISSIYRELISLNRDLKYDDIPNDFLLKKELTKIEETTLTVDTTNNTITRLGEATIDLGAFAKGYATSLVKTILKENGITYYMINAGKSSIIFGEKPNSQFYHVGLENIDNVTIKIKNKDLGTSSISEQHREYNGVTYHHIINPKTGKPSSDYDSLYLIGEDSGALDALSTALFSMNLEEIKEIIKRYSIDCIIYKDNTLVYQSSEVLVYE